MHFAGLKAVGESAEKPFDYYVNNVTGTLQLLAAMGKASVKSQICPHLIQLACLILNFFSWYATNLFICSKQMASAVRKITSICFVFTACLNWVH